MIPRTTVKIQPESWQQQWQQAFTRPAQLLEYLQIDPAQLDCLPDENLSFPMRVPRAFAARMRPGDAYDPLLRQVLPGAEEMHHHPAFGKDPVGDGQAGVVPGLLHKYHGRALLITSPACAVHCRYCFRREYPYQQATASGSALKLAIEHLREDDSITEVILSGGDPLSLTDRRLTELVCSLEQIPQLRRLRLHSRLPVVLPDRITDALLQLLQNLRLQSVLVVHINHPSEIDGRVSEAMSKIADVNCQILNQTVLLKGVNDDEQVLTQLSEKLFQARILPYYLHQLDRVQGAAHFEVSDLRALSLESALRRRLPGYLVPRLVREVAGQSSKSPLLELMQQA